MAICEWLNFTLLCYQLCKGAKRKWCHGEIHNFCVLQKKTEMHSKRSMNFYTFFLTSFLNARTEFAIISQPSLFCSLEVRSKILSPVNLKKFHYATSIWQITKISHLNISVIKPLISHLLLPLQHHLILFFHKAQQTFMVLFFVQLWNGKFPHHNKIHFYTLYTLWRLKAKYYDS